MVCLGLEPRLPGWWAQTNPLKIYFASIFFNNSPGIAVHFAYLQSLLSQIKNLSTELVHFVRSEHWLKNTYVSFILLSFMVVLEPISCTNFDVKVWKMSIHFAGIGTHNLRNTSCHPLPLDQGSRSTRLLLSNQSYLFQHSYASICFGCKLQDHYPIPSKNLVTLVPSASSAVWPDC